MTDSQRGYTTVELLIAISITLTVIGFAYTAYFFSSRMLRTWREKTRCENTALICMDRMTADARRFKDVLKNDAGETALIQDDGGTVVYRIEMGNLFRNGYAMNPPSVTVDTFIVRRLGRAEIAALGPESASPAVAAGDTVPDGTPVALVLSVHNRFKRITLKSAVMPRNAGKRSFDRIGHSPDK